MPGGKKEPGKLCSFTSHSNLVCQVICLPCVFKWKEKKDSINKFECMISPIERKFVKHFAVLYLWDLGRKLHKDFGNPQMCICIFPYSMVFPSSIAKHSGLQRTAQLIWEVWLGVGWAHPPCSHTPTAPIGRFQVGHQKCDKLGFFLGVCGEPKWYLAY